MTYIYYNRIYIAPATTFKKSSITLSLPVEIEYVGGKCLFDLS